MTWFCWRSIHDFFISFDNSVGPFAPTGSICFYKIWLKQLVMSNQKFQNVGNRLLLHLSSAHCSDLISISVWHVKVILSTHKCSSFNSKLIPIYKQNQSKYLVTGAGNPWAGQNIAKELLDFRSILDHFTSLGKVGDLAPTGSTWKVFQLFVNLLH